MPIFNNHPSVVEVVTGAIGSNSGENLISQRNIYPCNSDSEVVTASGDLDFESILEVEGFLENSVFEDEDTSCGSSSTFGPG